MKKTMKTRIAAGLLAATTMMSSAVSVSAKDVSDLYAKLFDDLGGIDIVYNGDVLEYTDVQPQIINDRVMIPFRSVLEDMGAQVNYDDATRTVTAVRGDTTINFSLDSNVIDIADGEQKSQLEMDVPMVVVNDRTLVPIRFMSNAFGMNVGWESEMKTVVIVDGESYVNKMKELPNIGKFMNVKAAVPVIQNGAFTISADFSSEETAFDFKIDTAYDLTCTGGAIGGKTTLNLDIDGLNSIVKEISKENVNLKNIENTVIDIVADDGVIYFKTDFIEKLSAAYPDVKQFSSIAKFADKNTWFKWDVEKFFNELAEESASYKPLANMISGGITSLSDKTMAEMLAMVFEYNGDVTLSDATSIDMVFSTYELMDKYVNVNLEENGDYSMKMDISNDMLIAVMNKMGIEMTAEDINELKDLYTFEIKAEATSKAGKTNESVKYVIGIDIDGVKFNLKLTATSTGDCNATAETPKAPKTALDVMDIVKLFENK